MVATLNKKIARKVLGVVDAGLCSGKGEPTPGKMCVEAAVCYALGEPHGDRPTCVDAAVRELKIRLNDSRWSSNKARAKGMRRIAIAQLGSAGVVDGNKFAAIVAEGAIRKIVPMALRTAAKLNPKFQKSLEESAVRCETEGTESAANAAKAAAKSAAAANAAKAAYAAYAAANAANAAYAAACAAKAAYAAACAANAAKAAANAANAAAADEILTIMAEIGVDALQQCGSPGCKWLDLCD